MVRTEVVPVLTDNKKNGNRTVIRVWHCENDVAPVQEMTRLGLRIRIQRGVWIRGQENEEKIVTLIMIIN